MYLFIDTETTGKYQFKMPAHHPAQPYVVQLAAILCDADGTELTTLSTLIRPDGWTIEPEAQAIHGISLDDCHATGVTFAEAMLRLAAMSDACQMVIAHNIDFDAPVIDGVCVRSRLANPLRGKSTYCTMKRATNVLKLPGRYGFKWPTLNETHRHFFGSELDGAHDALVDVIGCKKCFFELSRAGVR